MSRFSKLRPFDVAQGKGFTLVELVVVSAIIFVITGFILLQQSKFNSATLLRSLTYSVALSVRQAQVYGTSVRESAAGSGTFASGYGVHFAIGTPSQYLMYADLPGASAPGNGAYDTGEALPIFTIGNGYVLNKFCATLAGGSTQHCTSGTPTTISSLSIYFRRPNTDACFSSSQAPAACDFGAAAVYTNAYVEVRSTGNNDTRSIKVTSTGQIAVCQPNLTDLSQC